MKQKELYKKVQLLKAGQIVDINGDWFKAHRVPEEWDIEPCDVCDLDSICRGGVAMVCSELDSTLDRRWYLKLASANRRNE